MPIYDFRCTTPSCGWTGERTILPRDGADAVLKQTCPRLPDTELLRGHAADLLAAQADMRATRGRDPDAYAAAEKKAEEIERVIDAFRCGGKLEKVEEVALTSRQSHAWIP